MKKPFFAVLGLSPLLLVLNLALASTQALAQPRDATLTLNPGRKIFYRTVTAKPGVPTLLLANGLIYDLRNWDHFIALCESKGYGVIQFAFSTQPESLRLLKESRPEFLNKGLELDDLADEFYAVYRAANVTGKVNLVTLSYGSIAAEFARLHPELVERMIIMSPLVVPSDRYDPNGKLLHFWLDGWRNTARWFDPFGLWSATWYNYTWDVIYGSFLRQRMEDKASMDPHYVPEGINAEVYKKSVFHMVRAARDFDIKEYARRAALPPVHLMLASEEDKPALADQLAFWEQLPERAQLTISLFAPAYHALAGANPIESYAWMDYVLDKKTAPGTGSAFIIRTGEKPTAERMTYPQLKQRLNAAGVEIQQGSH